MSDKYCYSTDQELYHGEFDTREDAEAELEEGGWTAKIRLPYDTLDKWHSHIGESIIERLDDYLIDKIKWDEAVLEAPPDKCAELGRIVLDWMRKNVEPNAWGVCEVREYFPGGAKDE